MPYNLPRQGHPPHASKCYHPRELAIIMHGPKRKEPTNIPVVPMDSKFLADLRVVSRPVGPAQNKESTNQAEKSDSKSD